MNGDISTTNDVAGTLGTAHIHICENNVCDKTRSMNDLLEQEQRIGTFLAVISFSTNYIRAYIGTYEVSKPASANRANTSLGELFLGLKGIPRP